MKQVARVLSGWLALTLGLAIALAVSYELGARLPLASAAPAATDAEVSIATTAGTVDRTIGWATRSSLPETRR